MQASSFPPIASRRATRLVLGSMPGGASLAAGEYYAHPQNSFWRILDETLGIPVSESYAKRCAALRRERLAVWDVLQSCTRPGSLDSSIVASSMLVNDFESFLAEHNQIRCVYFNGAMAERVFTRQVLPELSESLVPDRLIRLPSTSPANASITYKKKLAAWKQIAEE